MELGKRKDKAGFSEKFLKHSNGGILWEQHEEVTSTDDAKRIAYKDNLRELDESVRKAKTVSLTQMKTHASFWKFNKDTIKAALETLVLNSQGSDNPIYSYKAHVSDGNGGKISGPAATIYSLNPMPEDGIVKVPPFELQLVRSTVEMKDGKSVIKVQLS